MLPNQALLTDASPHPRPAPVTSGSTEQGVGECVCTWSSEDMGCASSAALCLVEMEAVTEVDVYHLVRLLGQ